jgi:hypothetical protein
MRRFLSTRLALLHKEWRDVRALTIACALLVPIGLISMEYGYLDWQGDFTAGTYVPACIGLYLAVIAADLIAADIATKRARAYAALPTRWASLWASKLTFLALAGTGFTVWTVMSCAAIYHVLAPEAADAQFIDQLSRTPREYVYAAPFGAATVVFWSTVLERGFAVVGAAVVTCAVLGGALPVLHWISPELVPRDDTIAVALVALPIVFLAGSLLAFTRTPQHSSSVWRRLATAAVIPIAILIPTGAVSAAVLSQRLVVEPNDPQLQLALGHVSPDGRHIVVHASKRHAKASIRTWILDIEDGSLAELGERNLYADWVHPWSDEGAYTAWTQDTAIQEGLRRLYDAETGEVLQTRSPDQVGTGLHYPFVEWATTRIEGADMIVTLSATGKTATLPARMTPRFSRIPGYALHTDSDGVHLHDLNADTSRIIRAPERYVSAHFSPTGAYVRTYGSSRYSIFDTRTGEELDVGDGAYLWFPGGGSDDRYTLLIDDAQSVEIVDLETGEHHAADPSRERNPSIDTRILSDRRVVHLTIDGRIEVRGLDGGNRRTIYAPREEQ